MRFTKYHNLSRSQAELDFVDVDHEIDTPLFIDPYVFSVNDDDFSRQCNDFIISFFEVLLDAVRRSDSNSGRMLLNNLHEPNETCLGFSKYNPQGRGIGAGQAKDLFARFAASEAVRTGRLSDISDCILFIDGISSDKISDITTNIIRSVLVKYTKDQCDLHRVFNLGHVSTGPLWDINSGKWYQDFVELPVVGGKPIMLVPKAYVRWKQDFSHDHQEYYNHFILNFLQEWHLSNATGLVHLLKNGKRKDYKEDLKKDNPINKDFLSRFSKDHPEIIQKYKKYAGNKRLVDDRDLIDDFDESSLCSAIIDQLRSIPAGGEHADKFHNLMIGVIEFLFYPHLVYPRKEHEIHDGRKRIDITYTNASNNGFFKNIHSLHNITAVFIMVECKNYSSDPANPELDQMSGRFSPNRGRFGMLIARTFNNKEKFIKRCQDTCRDGRGFILPIVDEDIEFMLNLIKNGKRESIDGYLRKMFEPLLG